MADKLNKLQIRALVLDTINSYSSEDDFSSDFHQENLKTLKKINNDEAIVEILLRELANQKDLALVAVKFLIADFATLEMVESKIWDLITNKNISDAQKGIYLQILRLLGGKIDVPLLMESLEDFNSIVDEQTQELLQIATVNPEAQIDFLDFLFSIKASEQIQLIESLENDFKGDELASVLAPCLKIDTDYKVKETVISILANSSSCFAIKPLKDLIKYNSDEGLKKAAIKALTQLASGGIDVDSDECIYIKENTVCSNSKFYKAYISQVDGCGNQGLIFSRIFESGNIIMFSTVINSFSGIIDCFGMSNLSVHDFQKVVSRFKANDLVVPVSAEVAKSLLQKAEDIHNQSGLPMPYEFACWNVYTSDIKENPLNYDDLLVEKITDFNDKIYFDLYDTESFDSWFLEYDDNIDIKNFLDFVVSIADNPTEENLDKIDNEIETVFLKIFTDEKINEYSQMLKNAAFIFYWNNNFYLSNIVINLANNLSIDNSRFLKDILKRSVLQYLANIVAQDDDKVVNSFKTESKKVISDETAFYLLNKLESRWDSDSNV